MPDTCEYEGCAEPAEGWVDAQWTIVDFVRYDLCHDHLWVAYGDLGQRTVDGLEPFYVGVHYYEDPIVWLTR